MLALLAMLAFILHVCTKARQPLKNALRTLESRDCLLSWQAALFREVASLEAQLAQAQADREESRNWAATYRDMLLKVT